MQLSALFMVVRPLPAHPCFMNMTRRQPSRSHEEFSSEPTMPAAGAIRRNSAREIALRFFATEPGAHPLSSSALPKRWVAVRCMHVDAVGDGAPLICWRA